MNEAQKRFIQNTRIIREDIARGWPWMVGQTLEDWLDGKFTVRFYEGTPILDYQRPYGGWAEPRQRDADLDNDNHG